MELKIENKSQTSRISQVKVKEEKQKQDSMQQRDLQVVLGREQVMMDLTLFTTHLFQLLLICMTPPNIYVLLFFTFCVFACSQLLLSNSQVFYPQKVKQTPWDRGVKLQSQVTKPPTSKTLRVARMNKYWEACLEIVNHTTSKHGLFAFFSFL